MRCHAEGQALRYKERKRAQQCWPLQRNGAMAAWAGPARERVASGGVGVLHGGKGRSLDSTANNLF